MISVVLNYLANSSIITYLVLMLLSLYFIICMWIFFYRFFYLDKLIKIEKNSLESLASKNSILSPLSALSKCASNNMNSKELLMACEINFIKEASTGVSWLSIIASTSPFIGLFGTVVGILESFAKFSNQAKVSFSIIAPAISEALVATAAGILVATFAYTFHQLILRKLYELESYLEAQSQILVVKG